MSPPTGFYTFLATTVVLLLATIYTGYRAKRRLHIPLVILTVASLGTAIYFAEKLGQLYDLDSAGAIYPIHITLAKTATGSFLLPIISGIRLIIKKTAASPRSRKLHGKLAYLALVLTLVTFVTGPMMLHRATLLDPAEPSDKEAATTQAPSSPQGTPGSSTGDSIDESEG